MYRGRKRPTQRVIALLAMFAMLLVALMPTVSRAVTLINGDATMFQDLCSGSGVKRVMTDASLADPAHQLAKHLESCGYCVAFGNDVAMLPIANTYATTLMALSHEMPARFCRATPKLHVWSNTQARAPPL
jgi:hypothetical protein